MTKEFKYFSECDKWKIGKVLWHTGKFVRTKMFQEGHMSLASVLIQDEEKLVMVTKECLDIIRFIEKKISFVETVIKYKDDEEEWEYYQFGKNEYQTDLFFIKNSDRIRILLNIIKKQNPKYKIERCKLACKAANTKEIVIDSEEDDPELLPILYEKKRRWKIAKKCMLKNLIWNMDSYNQIEEAKIIKWKKRHLLSKENKKMTIGDYILHYHYLYTKHFDEFREAEFYGEGKPLRIYEWKYEIWYEKWNEEKEWEAMEQKRMKESMKKMNSSIWDLIQEAEYEIKYEKETARFLRFEEMKKLYEGKLKTRISEYWIKEKKRKERKWKNFSSTITNLSSPKNYGHC
jgi:hypothetical protein